MPATTAFNVQAHSDQSCTFTGKDWFGDGWGHDCYLEFVGKQFTVQYKDNIVVFKTPLGESSSGESSSGGSSE